MAAQSESTAASPEQGHCPRCDYYLHGLPEPRCPECGYLFSWEDVRAETLHRYLFEHHPQRNAWSFFRTLRTSLLPMRFWRGVKLTHRVDVRRLLLYWLLCTGILTIILLALFSWHALLLRQENESGLLRYMAFMQRSPAAMKDVLDYWGSLEKYRRRVSPPLLSVDFAREAAESFFSELQNPYHRFPIFRSVSPRPLVIALLWPGATLALMVVFQGSLRRAKVSTRHVLRCIVYGCSTTWLLILLAMLIRDDLNHLLPPQLQLIFGRNGWIEFQTAVVLAAFVGFQLAMAFRHYLKLAEGIAVATRTQIFLLLAVLAHALATSNR